MSKLITFAVPCYNSAAYMDHCVRTLLTGGDDIEIILVDDGSTKDDTPAICDRYQAEYPDIVRAIHQENVDGGKSVDTSMGFTPLAGVPMGTRAGDLDAGILEYLMGKHGYDMKEMMTILNKKSGVLGISGVSSDFRDLENAAKEGNQRAELALEAFQYSVKKLVGAYAAAMGGVDAIVFTAGVGENDAATRMAVASGLEFMGVKMDAEANNVRGKETVISSADSKVKVLPARLRLPA